MDLNDPLSVISSMSKVESEEYKKQGVIADGMIPKLDNSFKAIENGVSKVIILHARNLLTGGGTLLYKK
jgi:acetylglutamate kinase